MNIMDVGNLHGLISIHMAVGN